MSKEKQIINKTLEKKYEYGFTTDIEQETIPTSKCKEPFTG